MTVYETYQFYSRLKTLLVLFEAHSIWYTLWSLMCMLTVQIMYMIAIAAVLVVKTRNVNLYYKEKNIQKPNIYITKPAQ